MENGKRNETIGVLLLTYGSPATLADVPQYLSNVRGGRPMPEEERKHLEAEFTRRYDLIGGSPLIARTREQAAARPTAPRSRAALLDLRIFGNLAFPGWRRFSMPRMKAWRP